LLFEEASSIFFIFEAEVSVATTLSVSLSGTTSAIIQSIFDRVVPSGLSLLSTLWAASIASSVMEGAVFSLLPVGEFCAQPA
jgi:hypothetical protein